MERGGSAYGEEVVQVIEGFVEEAPDGWEGKEEDAEEDGEWRGAGELLVTDSAAVSPDEWALL